MSQTEPAVWYAIPSARPDGGTLRKWQEKGYKVAAFRDVRAEPLPWLNMVRHTLYEGYAKAVNLLCEDLLGCEALYGKIQIIVTGGDDVDPPDADPYEIQRGFVQHFPDLYGVMQPTGDRWMVDDQGRSASERVAYSPWMGREWVLRANGSRGPLWPEYYHFFVDEHLQCAATMQGVFWQRPNLCQYHHWWGREGGKRPLHLVKTEAGERWREGKALFEAHQAHGFIESLPLPAATVSV